MNTLKFISILFVIAISVWGKSSHEIMRLSGKHYKVIVDYDGIDQTIRLKLSNDSLSKSLNLGGPYLVSSPENVDSSLGQIHSFLNTYNVNNTDVDSIIARIEEFKYISHVSCEALHFSVIDGMDAQEGRINSLLGEIVKITNFNAENSTPSRSLLIDTFNIGEKQKIQLRMVLDQDGHFLSFSFAKATGTMAGYKWYTKGKTVYLKNLLGDVVLAVDLENFYKTNHTNTSGGLILVKSPKQGSIENENRSYIRLSPLKNHNWKIDRYNTQFFRGNIAKNGVALSSSFAKHTPVIQLQGSDIYFPKLDAEELFDKYKKDDFKGLTFSVIEASYNECMGERTSLAQEQISFGHADLDVVEADTVVFCERLGLLNQKEFRTNITYRSCLLKNDVLIGEEGFQYLNFSFLLKMSIADFEEIVSNCKSRTEFTEARSIITQKINRSKLTLSKEERNTFQIDLNKCFFKLGAKTCKDRAHLWFIHRSLLNFLDKKSGHESSCRYSFIGDDAEDEFRRCYKTSLAIVLDSYDLSFFREGAYSLGNTPVTYSDTDYILAHDKFRLCMVAQLEGESSPLDKKDKWYQFEQYCLADALKLKMGNLLKSQAYKQISDLMGQMGDTKVSIKLEAATNREISKILDDTHTLNSYSEIRDKVALKVYSLISSYYLKARMDSIDDRKFHAAIKSFLLDGGSSGDSLIPSMRLSLRSISRRVTSRLIELSPTERLTYVKNLIKTTEINALDLEKGNKAVEVKKTVLARTYNDRKKCLNDLSVAQDVNFSDELMLCKQKAKAELTLEESRIKFEKLVTSNFLVNSYTSNKLLSILTDLKSCLKRYTFSQYHANKRYEALMQGCDVYAMLQLKQGISHFKLKSYDSIVNSSWGKFQQCFQQIAKSGEGDFDILPDEYDLALLNSLGEVDKKDRYLDFIAKHREELYKGIAHCEDNLNHTIVAGVKDHLLEKVPSLSHLADSEKNKLVLANFFDEQMIIQIIEFNKINAAKDKGSAVDLGALVSDERVITTAFGVNSLRNFIDTLGSYFNKGFIYDESGMRTELVIFKSQLKDFLHWYNSNPDKVTIREAKAFFGQSKLGEHLSLAVVSEQVYTKFTHGINSMRSEEERKFFAKTSCKTYWQCFEKEKGNTRLKQGYDSMMKKYDNLLKLTKKMTSSYDFRRIIGPETANGKKVIKLTNDAVLAPAILGVRTSAVVEQKLMDALGTVILADNTDGGFSERFVQEVANYSLREQKKDKYSITKWLFNDAGDFDWGALRKTRSGQEALNYYARFIMLPRMLGRKKNSYIRNLRQSQFEKLIRQAQSENKY